jgi:hypothetical protein
MSETTAHDEDMISVWDRVEAEGTARDLTDTELFDLYHWCQEREIALPPAQWVAEEFGRRDEKIRNAILKGSAE